jgi:hypothetical protein
MYKNFRWRDFGFLPMLKTDDCIYYYLFNNCKFVFPGKISELKRYYDKHGKGNYSSIFKLAVWPQKESM